MRRLVSILVFLAALTGASALVVPADGHAVDPAPRWKVRMVDADQNFRGLDAVNGRVAWITGESQTDGKAGKVFRTTDKGRTWKDVTPPGKTDSFRDVEAFDADTAVVLSIGPGTASRIWRTTDGGKTWTSSFRNTDKKAFYNCLDFYADGLTGLAVSDPVNDRLRVAATHDGGETWEVLPERDMPKVPGEYEFSASGDCLAINGDSAWIGTGGAKASILRTDDQGSTWTVARSGIPAGEAAGVFALAFASPTVGIAVGGDFADPADGVDAVSRTTDGARWTGGIDLPVLGEDVAFRAGSKKVAIVTGEYDGASGTSLTRNGGSTWRSLGKKGFHTLDCTDTVCWGAGSDGRIGRMLIG